MEVLEARLVDLASQDDMAWRAIARMAAQVLDVGSLIDLVHLGCMVRLHTAVDSYLVQTALLLKMLQLLVTEDGKAVLLTGPEDAALSEYVAAIQSEVDDFAHDIARMTWRDRKDTFSTLGVHTHVPDEIWNAFKRSRWTRNESVHDDDDEPNYVGWSEYMGEQFLGAVNGRSMPYPDLVSFDSEQVHESIWACAAFIEALDEAVSRTIFGEEPGWLHGLSTPFEEDGRTDPRG